MVTPQKSFQLSAVSFQLFVFFFGFWFLVQLFNFS